MDNFLDKFEKLRVDVHMQMLNEIKAMNNEELQQLGDSCDSLTTTNCGFRAYDTGRYAALLVSTEVNKRKMQDPKFLDLLKK